MHEPRNFSEVFDGVAHRLGNYMDNCRNSLLQAGYAGDDNVLLDANTIDSNLNTYVYNMAKSTLDYFKKVIYNSEAGETTELADDVRIYQVCRLASPITLRNSPIMNFETVRASIR